MVKKVFTISGMHCTSCALAIDGELEDTHGIVEANTNYAKSQTEVVFDEEKMNEKNIIKIIQQVGYQASVIQE